MHLNTLELLDAPAAGVVQYEPTHWVASSDVESLPLNENMHLAGPRRGGWLAAHFVVPGSVDVARMSVSVDALVKRHPVLQRSCDAAGARRFSVAPRHLPRPVAGGPAQLEALFDEACAATDAPAYRIATVERPDGDTNVIAAFDHSYVDAWSMQVVVRDLDHLYRGADLPRLTRMLPRDFSDDENLIARWHRHLDEHDGLPGSPFDLGVAKGPVAAHTLVEPLLDREQADALERSHDTSIASSFVGALARANVALGAPALTSCTFPVHTRRHPGAGNALGWFVTNTPLTLDARADAAQGAAAIREALAMAPTNLATMLAAYERPVTTSGMFTFSFLDYRRVPGHDTARLTLANQLSGRAPTDGLQLWIARTNGGVQLRVRHPDTRVAHMNVAAWTAHLRSELCALTSGEPEPELARSA